MTPILNLSSIEANVIKALEFKYPGTAFRVVELQTFNRRVQFWDLAHKDWEFCNWDVIKGYQLRIKGMSV